MAEPYPVMNIKVAAFAESEKSSNSNSRILLDFSLTVNAATLIIISGCGLAISSAKEGKSGFIYNLVKC